MKVNDPLLEIALQLEEIGLHDDYFLSRNLYPNVDFYSGIIYRAIGIPTRMFTVMFALGRLLTEGWITSADEVERVAVCAQGLKISVQLRHPLAAAEQAGQEVPSCCTDNLTLASPVRLPPLAPVPQREIPAAWVDALADAMGQGLPLYRATHAVHSCLLLRAGKILYRCEDLGRHNALDKAVGCALTEGVPLAECVLFTSGRVPVDMVRKAIRAGVPALVSKSMPTVQSLELAEEYGLKLFIRQKK